MNNVGQKGEREKYSNHACLIQFFFAFLFQVYDETSEAIVFNFLFLLRCLIFPFFLFLSVGPFSLCRKWKQSWNRVWSKVEQGTKTPMDEVVCQKTLVGARKEPESGDGTDRDERRENVIANIGTWAGQYPIRNNELMAGEGTACYIPKRFLISKVAKRKVTRVGTSMSRCTGKKSATETASLNYSVISLGM